MVLKYLFFNFSQVPNFDVFKLLRTRPRYQCYNNSIIGEDESTNAPDTTSPPSDCADSIPASKCKEWKNRGICDKKWVQERCKATCQLCTSYCGFVVISRTSIVKD